MSSKRGPARENARWWADDEVWLDHTVLSAGDAEWLAPARKLRMSAVKAPDGLLAQLPHLEWLVLRGGSGTDVRVADGCSGLRYLSVDQIRGCADLSVLPALTRLELLSLYGLPRVSRIPSLAPLSRLRRVEVGSVKGLEGLTGLLDAPNLTELQLSKAVGLEPDDADRIAAHPSIRYFTWLAVDVPNRIWVPFTERVGLPRADLLHPFEWFDRQK